MLSIRLLRAPVIALFALAGSSFVTGGSNAAVVYGIEVLSGTTTVGTGSLDFTGSLASDGTFPRFDGDLAAFSLTFTGSAPPVTITLGDLRLPSATIAPLEYTVLGGELVEIDTFQGATGITSGACSVCIFETGLINTAATSDALALVDISDSDPSFIGGTYVLSRAAAPTPMPEPGTLGLFVLGLAALSFARRLGTGRGRTTSA